MKHLISSTAIKIGANKLIKLEWFWLFLGSSNWGYDWCVKPLQV